MGRVLTPSDYAKKSRPLVDPPRALAGKVLDLDMGSTHITIADCRKHGRLRLS